MLQVLNIALLVCCLSTANAFQLGTDAAYSSAVAAVSRVWIAGGSNAESSALTTINIFDTATLTLTNVSPTLSIPRTQLGGAYIPGTDEVVFGYGWDGVVNASNSVDIFSASTGQLLTSFNNATARYGLGCGAALTYVVFAGGRIPGGYLGVPNVDIYNRTGSGTTRRGDNLAEPRWLLASASLGNLIFFAGGQKKDGGPSSVVDIFDMSRLTKSKTQLRLARWNLAAVAVPNHNLVIFAGGFDGRGPVGTIDIYNVTSKLWVSPSTLPMPRHSLSAAVAGDLVFFAGGIDSTGLPSSRVEIFNVQTMRWESSTSLSVAGRANMTAASISAANNESYVVFAGGKTATNFSDVLDVFDASGTRITLLTPPTTNCSTRQPFDSAVCIDSTWLVNGSVVIDHENATFDGSTPILISGNLTIANLSVITINSFRMNETTDSAPILSASGCVTIEPSTLLRIDLGDVALVGFRVVNLVESLASCNGIEGNFSSIQVITPQSCVVDASPLVTSTQLSILVSARTESCRSNSNSRKKKVTAIIAGAVLFAFALLFAAALILFFCVYRKRRYRGCDCFFKITKTKSGTEM